MRLEYTYLKMIVAMANIEIVYSHFLSIQYAYPILVRTIANVFGRGLEA